MATVLSKLGAHPTECLYGTVGDLNRDVSLVVDNAIAFNDGDSVRQPVADKAKLLRIEFSKLFLKGIREGLSKRSQALECA